MNDSTYVILLTACVNPNQMAFTKLQDPQIRRKQYLQAISYYVEHTRYKLVVCNNTGDDFNNCFDPFSERIEYLFFDGNNYDRSLGKGYGEFEIIRYAILNSRFIKQAQIIIKITGRLIISNLKSAIAETKTLLHLSNNTIMARVPSDQPRIFSECVVAPKDFYDFFIAQPNSINDSANYYFEHFLFDSIQKGCFSVESYTRPLIKEGISGTFNEPYHNDHYRYLNQMKEIQMYYRKKRDNASWGKYDFLLLYISVRMFLLSKYWATKKIVKNLIAHPRTN